MNKEKIIIELTRISTPTGLTPYGDITLDDYTCDEILDFINMLDEEKTNLKQVLIEIRKIFTECKMLMSHEFDWEEQADNILQIIDEGLGGRE